MNKKLSALLARPDIWQASSSPQQSHGLNTGYPLLNKALHRGGWPVGAITELLCDQTGIGELEILLPALRQYARQHRKLVFVAPPYIPYAPALQNAGISPQHIVVIRTRSSTEQLWTVDQLLRADVAGAVLCWMSNNKIDHRQLRKLQLAAQTGQALTVLFRPTGSAAEASPAALRIALSSTADALSVSKACRLHILKQRGGWAGQVVDLARPDELLEASIAASDLPVHKPAHKPAPQIRRQDPTSYWDFDNLFPDNQLDSAPDTPRPQSSSILH